MSQYLKLFLKKRVLIPISIILVIYFGLSFYVTVLSFQSIINVHEENPADYKLQFEEVQFNASDNSEFSELDA